MSPSGLAAVAGWVGLAAATLQSWGERLHSREDDVDVAVEAGGLAAEGGGRPQPGEGRPILT